MACSLNIIPGVKRERQKRAKSTTDVTTPAPVPLPADEFDKLANEYELWVFINETPADQLELLEKQNTKLIARLDEQKVRARAQAVRVRAQATENDQLSNLATKFDIVAEKFENVANASNPFIYDAEAIYTAYCRRLAEWTEYRSRENAKNAAAEGYCDVAARLIETSSRLARLKDDDCIENHKWPILRDGFAQASAEYRKTIAFWREQKARSEATIDEHLDVVDD